MFEKQFFSASPHFYEIRKMENRKNLSFKLSKHESLGKNIILHYNYYSTLMTFFFFSFRMKLLIKRNVAFFHMYLCAMNMRKKNYFSGFTWRNCCQKVKKLTEVYFYVIRKSNLRSICIIKVYFEISLKNYPYLKNEPNFILTQDHNH